MVLLPEPGSTTLLVTSGNARGPVIIIYCLCCRYDAIIDLTRRLNSKFPEARQVQLTTRGILNSLFPRWLPGAFKVNSRRAHLCSLVLVYYMHSSTGVLASDVGSHDCSSRTRRGSRPPAQLALYATQACFCLVILMTLCDRGHAACPSSREWALCVLPIPCHISRLSAPPAPHQSLLLTLR